MTSTLNPVEFLDLAQRAAKALHKKLPMLSRDEYDSQVLVTLVETCKAFDPDLGMAPERFVRCRLRQRLLDYARVEIGRRQEGVFSTAKAKARQKGMVYLDTLPDGGSTICPPNLLTPERAVLANDEAERLVEAVNEVLTDKEKDFLFHEERGETLRTVEIRYGCKPDNGAGCHQKNTARKKLRAYLT